MVKKESKKAATPAVEEEPPPPPAEPDAPPWWEAEYWGQPVELEGLTSLVYLVLEATDGDADLLSMLLTGVRSGVRRKFALLEREEVFKLLPDAKKASSNPKAAKGGKKGSKLETPGRAPSGVSADQAMLQAASERLHVAGQLDAAMTAMVVKFAVSQVLANRREALGADDTLPMPDTPDAARSEKAKKKEAPGKKKNAAKQEKAPDEAAKDKEKQKEDKEFEAFCDAKQTALRKRGEPLEPAYKDDEPPDGPDLFLLLVGFSEPRLPLELAACGLHLEAVLRLAGEPCQLGSARRSPARSGRSVTVDRAAQFWAELPGCLAPEPAVGRLKDTALAEVVVDRCRVQFATDAAHAADQVFDAAARELYRHLKLRALFDKYVQSVAAVAVPDAPRPPEPPPADEGLPQEPPEPEAEPAPELEPEPEPVPEPCLQEPVEYRRLLAQLPAETVTVPFIVNALVEQVCVWAAPDGGRPPPEELVEDAAAGGEPREDGAGQEEDGREERAALKAEFPPQQMDADRGPVLVYEGDAVNADFCDWQDRDVVLSAEHVLTQSGELQALLNCAPPPDASLWRYHAARQQLQAAPGGPGSAEAADLLLRQLVFESMYAALTPGDGAGPRPYPHPFLPAQSVRPDAQWLVPECGDAVLADGAAALDSGDELLRPPARFAAYRVCERLGRLTMAQALEAARAGRQLLAEYHFGGDDGLYLVYGHPRVRRGRLRDAWQLRAHTAVGFRDFLEHVQHWPEVSAWLQRQHAELVEEAAALEAPLRPALDQAAPEQSAESGPAPPDGERGVQLPDAVFLVPGSIKHEKMLQEQQAKEEPEGGDDAPAKPKPPPEKKPKKRKESRRVSKQRSGSTKSGAADRDGSPPPPAAPISVVQFEIRPKTPDAGRLRERPPSPVPPEKVFRGYDLELGRLLHVTGHRQRQYFSNGSHVTVRRSEYVHGPSALAVSVRHGETRLTLHPGERTHELVARLSGGVLLHPRPELRRPASQPAPPPPPPAPAAEDAAPQSRRSLRHRSPPGDKSKKKESRKKEAKRGGKKRATAAEEEPPPPPPPPTEEPPPSPPPAEPAEAARRVQTLRLSCPSGLVVELQPEPFWPGPEPRVRVVQYYVDTACERRRLRVHLSDGTLLLMNGDDQPDDQVLMIGVDGGITTFACSEAGLTPLSEVTAAGRRLSHAADPPAEPRPLLSKMATDPVTLELYVQREDGVRAVVRPGGQSALQFPDGTRVTQTVPEEPAERGEPRPPGCSDYLVNEAGWIGRPRVSWLLGARVTVDDAAADQRAVLAEHPQYARVLMDRCRGRCEVRLPQGLLLEAAGSGLFYLSQPDGSRLQIDEQLLCFSTPAAADDRRPVVHTMRLSPPEPEPPPPPAPAEQPPAVSFADPAVPAEAAEPAAAEGAAAAPAEAVSVGEAASAGGDAPPEAAAAPGSDAPTEPAAASDAAAPSGSAAAPSGTAAEPSGSAAAPSVTATEPSETATEPPAPDAGQSEPCEEPPPPPPLDTLCETVDSDGSVWRVTRDGQLVPVDSNEADQLPDPLPLELRRQLDEETVMPEPARLFVLYREGDGLELLPFSEVDEYLDCVERTPGGIVVREPHMSDAELTVVRSFRPAGDALANRWHMAYSEPTIVPPNLRCRDLRLLSPDEPPPEAGSHVWGRGDGPAADAPPLPLAARLPAGLVLTRELLVAPPLEAERRAALLRAVHEARLRYRADASAELLPAEQPAPAARLQHVYRPDRLLELVSAPAAASPPASATPRPRHESRALSMCGGAIRELDKILIYRDALRRRRFPPYFVTAEGRQFLAALRQTAGEDRPPAGRRRLRSEPVRLAAAPGGPARPGDVGHRPRRLDLGMVRPGETAAAELQLLSAAGGELAFRVTPPPPVVGLRVRPDRGRLPPRGEATLRVEFAAPAAELRGRSVYCLLELVVEEVDRLHVPVVVCVASGGAADVLRDDFHRA